MVKGLGYSLEAMMAVIIILIFSLGAVQVSSPSQDWAEYQRHVAAQDITYSMQTSGKLENFIKRGELGSFQDAATTISDRDMEVSGAVSNLPLYEFSIGYFARPENRFDQSIVEVQSEDRCYDELEELEGFVDDSAENPIYRTENSSMDDLSHDDNYGVTIYFGNTNPTGSDTGVQSEGYDTLWVDNGTRCQFANEDGPYYLNQIFFWGDTNTSSDEDYFDFKSIDVDKNQGQGNAEFYLASQAYNIKSTMNEGINGIATDISLDVVDFDEIDSENHHNLIFAENQSLNQINQPQNLDILESHMVSGTILFLMNPAQTDLQTGFLDQANLDWIDTGYKDGYNADPTTATFSSNRKSMDLDTLYRGMKGDQSDLELRPPSKVVSGSSNRLESGRVLYSSSEEYNFSEWDRYIDDFEQVDPEDVEGEPPSSCYDDDSALTRAEADFPDTSGIQFINAEVGDCNGNRSLRFDFNDNGVYDSEIYLNGEKFIVEDREYFIDIYGACPESVDGECVDFKASGQELVELMPHTSSFESFSGGQIAMLGYQNQYNDEQTRIIAASIHWLTGGEYGFEGREPPSRVDTSAMGSVDEEIYMPYEVNLRWSE